jgi:hypothetical protein
MKTGKQWEPIERGNGIALRSGTFSQVIELGGQ